MLLEDILQHNHAFVENKDYEAYVTNSVPDKHAVILTCMDTRLTELLERVQKALLSSIKQKCTYREIW